ncbi:endo-1,3(4)-beta-glucanase [Rhypophila decipiens]|uniref:Endo-1,3(4)-beta-glucanase n=1 Tax=Rhypophila decipiens TaxID=261697 RepID=A0AAN6XTP5_9PEZI|nr:endo-1,3(4)-beta-glucanase [Rhypophila decipiens]
MSSPRKDGFSLVWAEHFGMDSKFPPVYHRWNVIKVEPNYGNNEVQWYEGGMDVTYIVRSHQGGTFGPGSAPRPDDQLFIMPQKKNGKWTSAKLEGKEAHGCPAGKQMILQAELRVGNASMDKQDGIWPAFWALGESRNHGVEWPECGEWDIMETSDGHDWTKASVHLGEMVDGKWNGKKKSKGSAKNSFKNKEFHTWALKVDRRNSDWKKQTLQWFMDDKQFFEIKGSDFNSKEWEILAHQKYYPVLNVAVGSNFPENRRPSDKTGTGIDVGMLVQYVAFYVSD